MKFTEEYNKRTRPLDESSFSTFTLKELSKVVDAVKKVTVKEVEEHISKNNLSLGRITDIDTKNDVSFASDGSNIKAYINVFYMDGEKEESVRLELMYTIKNARLVGMHVLRYAK